jgi:hypothetical protein
MLGSVSAAESEWGRFTKQPDEIGGAETQSAYLIVSDADAVYAKETPHNNLYFIRHLRYR